MDRLHQLHDAVIKLWNFIKKYDGNVSPEEMIAEAENISAGDEEISDLLKEWIVKYFNYVDRRKK